MQTYVNYGGDSGVDAFEIAADYIIVRFLSGDCYKYTSESVGSSNLEQMKALARQGEGLNAFINTNSIVRTGYTEKYAC
jgi:hypothetical protein